MLRIVRKSIMCHPFFVCGVSRRVEMGETWRSSTAKHETKAFYVFFENILIAKMTYVDGFLEQLFSAHRLSAN